jgi:hypothetical protein
MQSAIFVGLAPFPIRIQMPLVRRVEHRRIDRRLDKIDRCLAVEERAF